MEWAVGYPMRWQASRPKSPVQPGDTAGVEHGFVQHFIFAACGAATIVLRKRCRFNADGAKGAQR